MIKRRKKDVYFLKSFLTVLAMTLLMTFSVKAHNAIQWREAFVTVDVQMEQIDSLDGQAIGMMRQRGFAFYDNDEIAAVEVWLTFERSGPETQYSGYAVYKFQDDTTKVGRFSGSGDPRGVQTGKFTFKKGTGRFEGITGQGVFTGQGFPPHGDIVLDVEGTYSLSDEVSNEE